MKFDQLANSESVTKVVQGLKERNVEAFVVKNRAEALLKIQELVPKGVSVMNGASRTLEELGYVELLKSGTHPWNNLHEAIVAEKDPVAQSNLRRQALLSDFYLGSVHALAETGEFVIASNTGSQLPHIVYSSPNLVFVVSTQKIVPTLDDAMRRLKEHVFPLEDARMKEIGYGGSQISKVLVFEKENPFMKRNVKMILVEEKLGF